MRIRAFACSTQGRVRLNNEDSFTLNTVAGRDPAQYPEQEAQAQPMRHTQWYGVFDGMGGEQCGEAVSRDVTLTRACVSVGRSEDEHIFIESNLMSRYARRALSSLRRARGAMWIWAA